VAAFRSAHDGQNGTGECEQAKDIGVELGANLLLVAFLYRGLKAVAGIVDERVDGAKSIVSFGNNGGNLMIYRNVKLDGKRACGIGFCQVVQGCGIAGF
jgi:hypothetical protein